MKTQSVGMFLLVFSCVCSVKADWLVKTYRDGSSINGLADADRIISAGAVVGTAYMAQGDMVGFSTGEGTGHFGVNNKVPGIPNNTATDNYAVQSMGIIMVPV